MPGASIRRPGTSRIAGLVDRLSRLGQRCFIARHAEGAIVGVWALAAFVVLWMVFDIVSLASVDLHPDGARPRFGRITFAFGYKHPPMTAWLFICGLRFFRGRTGRAIF